MQNMMRFVVWAVFLPALASSANPAAPTSSATPANRATHATPAAPAPSANQATPATPITPAPPATQATPASAFDVEMLRAPARGAPVQFRVAYDAMSSDPLKAARQFDDLRQRYSLLEDYCFYYAASAYHKAKQYDLAAARASQVRHDSTLDADTRLLLADALSSGGRIDEARAVWREYLEKYPNGPRRAEAYFRLGRHSRAYATGTLGVWEESARPFIDPKSLPAEDHLTRGEILASAQRHDEALAEFTLAVARCSDVGLECQARFGQAEVAWRMRDRTSAAPLYAQAAVVCDRAGDHDRVIRALYQQGRCLVNLGKSEEAAAVYAKAQVPTHSYGDDAQLREAEAWAEAGNSERAAALLSTLPDVFPEGDMRQEAIWRLARMAWFDGKLDEALGHLERGLTLGRETEYYSEGRTHYWRARVLDRLGRTKEAAQALERVIREYPLSYYSLWSLIRLKTLAADIARRVEQQLYAISSLEPAPLKFEERPVFSTDAFRRGVDLWRVGFRRDARREWATVGIASGGENQDVLWLVAQLLDAEGAYPESHDLPRRVLSEYRAEWPAPETIARWRIAYPQAHRPLIEREARRAGIPWTLLMAIVREESGFDPRALSYAHAYGLTQLILPTAKRFAPYPRRVTAERLFEPEFNVPIGARFLAFEFSRYRRISPLAVAAYNAGEGAVDRWMRERASLDLDEFVESIPYDQTRRYTKRVLSTYLTYAVLYGKSKDRLPTLPLRARLN